MLRWIAVLFLIPILDATLLAIAVYAIEPIGLVLMILFVVLTGLVGMVLVRAEGRRTLRNVNRSLARGEPPTNELLDGALIVAAGAFLLTPGVVTDLLGFALIVPPTRIPIRAGLKRFVVVPYLDKKADGFVTGNVWTVGFPGQEPAGTGGTTTGESTSSTYDLGAEEYTVTDGAQEDGYTIDLEDEHRDDSDGETNRGYR